MNDKTVKNEFINILKNREITPVYQAIVCLKTGEELGYEALSRGPKNSVFSNPEHLFTAAKDYNMVWELDMLCRQEAIRGARGFLNKKILFLNIDSNIINDSKFKKGFTRGLLSSYEIETGQIVFEITEHTAISDFQKFNHILDNYRGQGYKIAIDDAGNGHSGLRVMTETRPNYIKLDMELIRNIDKDIIKKELLKSFVKFAEIADIKLIAEGIETKEELRVLISIGIHYGQGFLLQRPQPSITPIDKNEVKLIKDLNLLMQKIFSRKERITIGDISRADETILEDSDCNKVNELFEGNKKLQAVIITNNEKSVIGLVMRNKFYYRKVESKNVLNFLRKPVTEVMDRDPLIVEQRYNIVDVCSMAISRKQEKMYDYVITVREGKYFGVVPVAHLLYVLVAINNLKCPEASTG
ncbi:EAL domain-containing protein [Serpentinicella alkaliphila]|uniref:EAL domain-containing protein (Putative c-di-GMP-specific phosphodiesterase class I) n=1 Tax=Serpentinicella alkaliphila TaxID=1734049 RepID=A0A4R2TJ14_9FIRM|nr:EAL domain-containing protein [Serpentinicella alkaliphila]QUH25356.1 EAL domain-containing protein [Serpentinicella alkaliphila]TCQ02357.1 EAL domain-containing protein (putative c-di-GMP-specific phosphodiesterase class I) [Serpentinicella alkaliphila]